MELKKIPPPNFSHITGADNFCLRMARAFLENHKHLIFCTSVNAMRKGLFYMYREGVYAEISEIEIDNMLLNCPETYPVKSSPLSKRKEIIENMKTLRCFYREDFNQENLINFKNGIFNLVDSSFHKHSPAYLSTIQLPYEYNPMMDCPLWLSTIEKIFMGDMEKIAILQEFMGYCLTKTTKYEKALFMVGEGQTGKSTVLETIEAMLGKNNISSLSLKLISNPAYIGGIMNKYANIVSEIPKNVSDYEDAFKIIVSGEPLTVNTKWVATYTDRPFCKLIFAANKLPRINDTSKAVFRRMLLLDFEREITEKEKDHDLKEKLKSEHSGVFNWAIHGIRRLEKQRSFTNSENMMRRINEIKVQNNSILFFCDEFLESTYDKENTFLAKKEVYRKYCEFCADYNIKQVMHIKNFNEELWAIFRNDTLRDKRKTINGIQTQIWPGIKYKDFSFVEDRREW